MMLKTLTFLILCALSLPVQAGTTISGVASGTPIAYNVFLEGNSKNTQRGIVTAPSEIPSVVFPNSLYRQFIYTFSIANDGVSKIYHGEQGIITTLRINRDDKTLYVRGVGVAPSSTFKINDVEYQTGLNGQFVLDHRLDLDAEKSIKISFLSEDENTAPITINIPVEIGKIQLSASRTISSKMTFSSTAADCSGPYPPSMCDEDAVDKALEDIINNYVTALKMLAQTAVSMYEDANSKSASAADAEFKTKTEIKKTVIASEGTSNFSKLDEIGRSASALKGKNALLANQKIKANTLSDISTEAAFGKIGSKPIGPLELEKSINALYLEKYCSPADFGGNMEVICKKGCLDDPSKCNALTNVSDISEAPSVDFDNPDTQEKNSAMSLIMTAMPVVPNKPIEEMTIVERRNHLKDVARASGAAQTVGNRLASDVSFPDSEGCSYLKATVKEITGFSEDMMSKTYGDGCSKNSIEKLTNTVNLDPNRLIETAGYDENDIARTSSTVEKEKQYLDYETRASIKREITMLASIVAMAAEREAERAKSTSTKPKL